MKFSDIEREQWPELQPYLDTALVPLSGLRGSEPPWQATIALERLRDALDPLENAYRGRVVTYPAVHYAEDMESLAVWVDQLCLRLYQSGFKFCIAVTGDPKLNGMSLRTASLLLGPQHPEEQPEAYRARARQAVESLWHETPAEETATDIEREL